MVEAPQAIPPPTFTPAPSTPPRAATEASEDPITEAALHSSNRRRPPLLVVAVLLVAVAGYLVFDQTSLLPEAPGFDLSERYTFQHLTGMEVDLDRDGTFTLTTWALERCDAHPGSGCWDGASPATPLSGAIPEGAMGPVGVWTASHSSGSVLYVVDAMDGSSGVVYTEVGIALQWSTGYAYNASIGANLSIEDTNEDGRVSMCSIGLSAAHHDLHSRHVHEAEENLTSEEVIDEVILPRYRAYLELMDEQGVRDLYEERCEADWAVGTLFFSSGF